VERVLQEDTGRAASIGHVINRRGLDLALIEVTDEQGNVPVGKFQLPSACGDADFHKPVEQWITAPNKSKGT
jgi:hypothetical protein